MKKYYILLLLLLFFITITHKREESPLVKEQQSIIEENQTVLFVKKDNFSKKPKKEPKPKQIKEIENQEDIHYCLDKVSTKKRDTFLHYEEGKTIIEVDTNRDGKIDFKSSKIFNDNGDLVLIEKDINNDGKVDIKEHFYYGIFDRLEAYETFRYTDKKSYNSKVIINYNDEEDIDDSDAGHKDIADLTKKPICFLFDSMKYYEDDSDVEQNDMANLPKDFILILDDDALSIEYHEEYDAQGRKILAYSGSKDYKRKSFRYFYDYHDNLLSKTEINYGMAKQNITTYFTKTGQISEIYAESEEELKARIKEQQKLYKEKLNNVKAEYRIFLSEPLYYQSRKEMNKILTHKSFHSKLIKAYRYNDKDKVVEEFDGKDLNISYKYDDYGNLIEKRRGDEILIQQHYKRCQNEF
jgi:YD repeat-containing protein